MINLAVYLALCAGLYGVFRMAFGGLEWAATGKPPRHLAAAAGRVRRLFQRRRRQPEPMPPALLGLELRRLGAEVRRIDASDLPAKAMRLRACTAAYDYVLLECCRSLEVPVPGERTPLTQDERFNAESSLMEAGFSW